MSYRPLSVHFLIPLSLIAGLVTGCNEPPARNYSEMFPLGASSRSEALQLHIVDPSGSFTDNEEAVFAARIATYLNRGHGPVTVAAHTSAIAGRETELAAVRGRLLAAGVPASAIRLLLVDDGPADGVTLSFRFYNAGVPGCGDWSGPTGWNPYNQVHSNFGCATQRNVGLMAADPADLVRMRDADPADPQNSNRVIQKYRAGQPTGATPNPLQSSGSIGKSSSSGTSN